MRFFKTFGTLTATLVLSAAAFAQNPRIIYPQEGQDVRGEVTMRFEGIPSGGYAIVRIDGQFKQASAQSFVVFDTLSDRVTFPRGDGRYKVDVTVISSGGGQVGTASVNFNVANSVVDPTGEAVRLVHWTRQDRIDAQVQRFRVFAESNATIEGGTEGGGGGGAAAGGGGGGGAEGGSESYLPAPLDYQVAALMRRIVRDVFVRDDTANISTIVQDSFERGREGGDSGAGANSTENVRQSRRKKAPSAPAKGPWLPLWTKSAETGKSFTKRIQQNGQEINATRKSTNVAIADLLPTFPDTTVHPGSTWETKMSILGDLTSRLPINVQAPITFTAYETIQTPNGESRRCAKLESRFRLPDNLAKKIAVNLGNKAGTGGGAGGGAGAGGEGGADAGLIEEDIDVARTNVARVLWFDMDRRQVLRSEDNIRSYFEIPPASDGAAAGPATGDSAAAPAEPTKINYNLSVTTWLDDRIPSPNEGYTGGLGTAHAVDNVTEPGLARVRGGR